MGKSKHCITQVFQSQPRTRYSTREYDSPSKLNTAFANINTCFKQARSNRTFTKWIRIVFPQQILLRFRKTAQLN